MLAGSISSPSSHTARDSLRVQSTNKGRKRSRDVRQVLAMAAKSGRREVNRERIRMVSLHTIYEEHPARSAACGTSALATDSFV